MVDGNTPESWASISLDLDNKWSYLKTAGDASWESLPSYLELVVPRVLGFLDARQLSITFFVVGQDAAQSASAEPLRSIAEAGHEIGNHSFRHEPWLHLYSEEQIDAELAEAHRQIQAVTGSTPTGFRGPGYSNSPTVMNVLARMGYLYDASRLPTFLGPVARLYYFVRTGLRGRQKDKLARLFGRFRDGFQSLHPSVTCSAGRSLVQIPVTTCPWIKTPIHFSYVLYLASFSRTVARWYFRTAVRLCRWHGVAPSLLLHPLDFLGSDDDVGLDFFPGMQMPSATKIALVSEMLEYLQQSHRLVTMGQHASHVLGEKRIAKPMPSTTAEKESPIKESPIKESPIKEVEQLVFDRTSHQD